MSGKKKVKNGVVGGADSKGDQQPEDVVQLVRDQLDIVKHVNHQNEHTQAVAERAQAWLDEQDAAKTIKET